HLLRQHESRARRFPRGGLRAEHPCLNAFVHLIRRLSGHLVCRKCWGPSAVPRLACPTVSSRRSRKSTAGQASPGTTTGRIETVRAFVTAIPLRTADRLC